MNNQHVLSQLDGLMNGHTMNLIWSNYGFKDVNHRKWLSTETIHGSGFFSSPESVRGDATKWNDDNSRAPTIIARERTRESMEEFLKPHTECHQQTSCSPNKDQLNILPRLQNVLQTSKKSFCRARFTRHNPGLFQTTPVERRERQLLYCRRKMADQVPCQEEPRTSVCLRNLKQWEQSNTHTSS